ncbi:MAG: protein kinase [Pseudonocardiales bacterium]
MASTSDVEARVIGGRYRLIERIGRGGMGTVWRARDNVLSRTVAVKEVDLPQLGAADREQLRERTMREARTAAQLSHPNAVTIYDVVEEDGQPWIIMQLVAADSLADLLREHGALPAGRVAEIGLAVLDALQAAHAAGILHRDVKPGNVLIGHDGRVVLTDFGIATLEGDSSLTSTGLLLGAPAYIAPERARGLRAGPASDLWSLGATLYTALEGRPPFERDSPLATVTALMTEEPPVPHSIGPLSDAIQRLLVQDPERRLNVAGARELLRRAVNAAAQPSAVAVVESLPDAGPPAVTAANRTQVIQRNDLPVVPPIVQPPLGQPSTVPPGTRPPDAERDGGPAVATAATPPTSVTPPVQAIRRLQPTPPRPLVAPSDDDERRGRNRALLAGALAIMLVAAVAAVLLVRNAQHPNSDGRPSTRRPSGAAQPRTSAAHPTPSTSPGPTESSGAAGGSSGAGGSAPGGASTVIPPGFVRYTDSVNGFSVAVPAGWQRTSHVGSLSDGQLDFRDPNSSRFLRFGYTTDPKDDPVADWENQEKRLSSKPGYHRISIKAVYYRGWPTADWEFLLGSTHVRDRGFKVDASHGYAIYLSAPDSTWSASLHYFDVAASTFQPAS